MSEFGNLERMGERLIEVLERIERALDRPCRRTFIATSFGPEGPNEMNTGTLNPGQQKTLTVAFTDTATPPVAHPLSALPTCVDPTNTLVITAVSTTGQPPAVTDPTFAWTVAAPASATVGASLPLTLSGVNPDGTTDDSQFPITIAAVDDTAVAIESFQ